MSTLTITRVRFQRPVPAPRTATRIRPSRNELDLQDCDERGFQQGAHGVSYGFDETRYLVPWAQVEWCVVEAQGEEEHGRRRKGRHRHAG